MVSLSERDAIVSRTKGDAESELLYSFIFEKRLEFGKVPTVPRTKLLRAIAQRNDAEFRTALDEIERRRVGEENDWWSDDSLVFLLLLGCRLFDINSDRLNEILSARERNSNPIPRKLNQVYRALSRSEFAMEGEYCFVKVTFLQLLRRLDLPSAEALRVYETIIRPDLLGELSPFNQVVALRAFDLILHARKPAKYENVPQLIEGFESLSKGFSLRQAWRVLSALPVKAHAIWIAAALGVITFLAGAGYKFAEQATKTEWSRRRPSALAIKTVQEIKPGALDIMGSLAESILRRAANEKEKKNIILLVETTEIGSPSPNFSIEVSHLHYPILDGFAFEKSEANGVNLAILHTRKNSGILKLLIPRSPETSSFVLLLCIQCPKEQTAEVVAHEIDLRILE